MITLHDPEWSSENAADLRKFLSSESGQRFVAMLVSHRPSFMSNTAHPHKSFACSREIHGYEQAVRTLLGLTESQEQPLNAVKNEAYPPLDDDSHWNPA